MSNRVSRNSPRIKIAISGKVIPGDTSAGRQTFFVMDVRDIGHRLYEFQGENPQCVGLNVTVTFPKLDGKNARGTK